MSKVLFHLRFDPTLASCPQTFLCVCHAWFYSRQLPAAAAEFTTWVSACPLALAFCLLGGKETFCDSLFDTRVKKAVRTPSPPDVRMALGNLLAAAVQQVAAAPLMGFLPPARLERLPSETGNWTLRAKKINNTLPGPTLKRVRANPMSLLGVSASLDN